MTEVDHPNDVTEIVRLWRADFTVQMERALLRYEATGNGREEIIALGEELDDLEARERWAVESRG